MIDNILNLLKIANEQNWRGQYIDVALGKNKFPETLKEMTKQTQKYYETN